MKDIKTISVVGGGLMGCGIAQVFAGREDLRVNVYDSIVSGDKILERIEKNLALFLEKELITQDAVRSLLSRVSVYDNLSKAVEEAGLVVECVPEKMELKQDLFKELEPLCHPDTIFATNTSVMSITEIARKAENKDRIVGTHFWNPPYLIPLVEVVKSDHTSEEVMAFTMETLKRAGKHAIRVNKDVPGFVANRMQHALWREAISIVENGIADAETVDQAVKMSFGLRLPVLAPLENADMVGTDLTLSIHSYLLKHLENSPEPSPLLRNTAADGNLGFKTGKGFREWTNSQIEETRNALTAHLIRMLYGK